MNGADIVHVERPAHAAIAPGISRLFMVLSALLAAAVVFEAAHVLYIQVITFDPLPHLDEWRTFILFSRVEQEPGSWSFLLMPHAEHRPLLPRLIFLLDIESDHGTGGVSLAATDVVLLGLVVIWGFLLAGNAGRHERGQPAEPCLLALCVAALLFSGHQMSNFVRGFQVTMFMVYFFAMLSFAAFAAALRQAANRGAGPPLLSICASCFFGICAAFSMGNGLIVLPVVFIMACVRRRELPVEITLIIGLVSAATIAAYLNAPGSVLGVVEGTDYKLASTRAIELARFFLAFLGGPWASIAPDGVSIAGLITLILSGWAIVNYWRRDDPGGYELVCIGVIALALGSAAAVALARLRFGMEAATESRYSTTVLMLYAAVLVSFWPKVRPDTGPGEHDRPSSAQTATMAVLAVCIVAYGLASHRILPYDYSGFPDLKADAGVAYVANVRDPLPFAPVAPQPQLQLAWQARDYMLRHHLSVFSTPAARSIDRRLTDVFGAPDGQCIGHLDQVERIIAGADGGFRLAGWAWDTDSRSVPPAVLLVEDGIVKGLGRFIRTRPDVVTAVPEVREPKTGFVGYVPRGATKATAYVLHSNQTSICRLPGDLALRSE